MRSSLALMLALLLPLVSCQQSRQLTPRERYVQALNYKMEGDRKAYYDELIALAADEPESRAGRRARASLDSGMSPPQVAAVTGILAAIAIPNFLNFRLKAKASEAKSNLGAIRSTQVAYFAEWNIWVGNQPYTPVPDRSGVSEKVPWVPQTRFSVLGFAPEGDVFCSYALEGSDFPTAEEGFTARAQCDLDGDGKVSIYTITEKSTEITHSGAPF